MFDLLKAVAVLFSICFASSPAVAAEPGPDNDYGRSEIGGSQGPIRWESMLRGDGLEGWQASDAPFSPSAWKREGDTIVSDLGDAQRARLVQGDADWVAYEFKVQATLVNRLSLQIHFGVSEDGRQSYFLSFLTGWKAIAIVRRNEDTGEDVKLDVVDFVHEYGREYDIVIKVRDHSFTSYIDGDLVNRLTLPENPRGGVAIAVWGHGTAARFRDPQVRHYYKPHHH
jgi:hypothetical protein